MNEELIVILQLFRISEHYMCPRTPCWNEGVECQNCLVNSDPTNTDFIFKIPIGVNNE